MKIALTRGNSENSTPPQDIPSIEEDLSNQDREVSFNFRR